MLALLLAVINLSNADPSPVTVPPAHIGDKVGGTLDLQGPLTSAQTLGTAAACAAGDPRIVLPSFNSANVLQPAATPCPATDDGLFSNNPFAIVPDAMRAMLVPEFSRYVPGTHFGAVLTPIGAPGVAPLSHAATAPAASPMFSHDVRFSEQLPGRTMRMMQPSSRGGGGGRGH